MRTENGCKQTVLHEAVRIDSELACFPKDGGTSPLYLAVLHDRPDIAQTLYHKFTRAVGISRILDRMGKMHCMLLLFVAKVTYLLGYSSHITFI